ncbi:MAG: LD-carboxypeptidase [Oscillospiraceae bacterium]|jgi:muramoyltetrapeptide carboxypeptidase|nr:LD-carboxypeptidase [Oscillospiraceae bacterium]
MIKPPLLKRGDTIGLLGPASPLSDAGKLEPCVRRLEELGYRVVTGASATRAYGYLAGDDATRAGDLNRMFADPNIDAIAAIRGGYGAMRLLDRLDYAAARANPKILIGFSDITALHIAYGKCSDLITFHSPMPVGFFADGEQNPLSQNAFDRALKRAEPMGGVPSGYPLETIAPGAAEGELIGGNLSLICALLGTPYEPDTAGKILFIEEVGERVYSIDRMLTQLRLAGKLSECAGIVLGDFANCSGSMRGHDLPLRQVFEDILAPCGKPILYGFSIGHCTPNVTLPLGARARLDADARTLTILEAAVSECEA